MDPVSLTLLTTAFAAGSGGLFSVIKKGVGVVLAERRFVREVKRQEPPAPQPSGLDTATTQQRIASLVRVTNLSDAEKNLLLDGLEQPSTDGQERYAQKLDQELKAAK